MSRSVETDPAASRAREGPASDAGGPTGPARCPYCGRADAVTGDLMNGHGPTIGFAPRNLRPLRSGLGVGLNGAFYSCASCGLVWSTLDPGKLRAFIMGHGEELAKQQLDEFDRGPCRDLPDTGVGREIGAAVAAVDEAARSWTPGAARTYRELRGVTWDQALRETRDWARLTREEKLALFGWVPKKKAAVDDLDSPFP